MPQMKPLMWLNISIIIYMNFFMILCLINSFPMKLNFYYSLNKFNYNKWNWLW